MYCIVKSTAILTCTACTRDEFRTRCSCCVLFSAALCHCEKIKAWRFYRSVNFCYVLHYCIFGCCNLGRLLPLTMVLRLPLTSAFIVACSMRFWWMFEHAFAQWCDVYSVGHSATAASLWSDREVLDNFCTVFVNFVSRLNVKSVSHGSCPLKTASKCTQSYHFGDKMTFSEEGPSLFTTPYCLYSYGASPPPYWNPKYATVVARFSVALSLTHALNIYCCAWPDVHNERLLAPLDIL